MSFRTCFGISIRRDPETSSGWQRGFRGKSPDDSNHLIKRVFFFSILLFLAWVFALNGVAVRAQRPAFQPLLTIRFASQSKRKSDQRKVLFKINTVPSFLSLLLRVKEKETQAKKEKNATKWNESSETTFPNLPLICIAWYNKCHSELVSESLSEETLKRVQGDKRGFRGKSPDDSNHLIKRVFFFRFYFFLLGCSH